MSLSNFLAYNQAHGRARASGSQARMRGAAGSTESAGRPAARVPVVRALAAHVAHAARVVRQYAP
ncbi:hypothetical protein ACFPTO_07710 [Paraburkholderia denitrificans]|uniref:Uncharacterized protein n=1 Tax=Paraburkholderia denitrificans TaxID=694025 RepID=A0ABW0J6J3_9BURK